MKNLLRKKKVNKTMSGDNKAEQESEQLIDDSDHDDNASVVMEMDTSSQQLHNFASHESWEKVDSTPVNDNFTPVNDNFEYKKQSVKREKSTSKDKIKTDKPKSKDKIKTDKSTNKDKVKTDKSTSKNEKRNKTSSVNSDSSIDDNSYQNGKRLSTQDNEGFRDTRLQDTYQDDKRKTTSQDVKLKTTSRDVNVKTTDGAHEVLARKPTLLELSRQCTNRDILDMV